ncbi:MAG: tyrosine-type recombinase/integrase [Solirubrobacteraceae bacterium]|jgi:site-specific recombinase XerD
MNASTLGSLVHGFFLSYLVEQKGLRQGSVRSYRDTLRLFLQFVAAEARRDVSKLTPEDLSFERVLAFLRHLEQQRRNSVTTRNQRLAALHTFFEFVARRDPDRLHECQQIAMIPVKRSTQPSMRALTREEVQALFAELPRGGRLSLRDRALLLFFYNTGARVQEVADLRVEQLALDRPAHVRLFGKGGKWRHCPLWNETASILGRLIEEHRREPQARVFRSAKGAPLTRFGLYKRVRRLTAGLPPRNSTTRNAHISPHVFRRTAAVHLLEAGVDVNVIRGWLGHSNLATTNRYAEITTRMKAEALRLCEIPAPGGRHTGPAAWRGEASLLDWLGSL